MNELKPCPFCGGEASLDYDFNGIGVTYGIHCPECHCAIIDTGTYSKDEAITAWNRRVQPELTRCEKCVYWDKSASFMSAHACAFWSSGKKRDTQKTMNFVHLQKREKDEEVLGMNSLSLRCPSCGKWLEVEDWEAAFIVQAREGWPHAIERAIKVEALARELVDMLGRVTPCYTEGRLGIDLDAVYEVNRLLKKAKEVLGIVRVKKHGSRLKKGGGCGEL